MFPATAYESLLKSNGRYFDCLLLKTELPFIYPSEEFLQSNISELRSRDNSVGIAKDYGLDGPGSIPGSAIFFFSPQRPDRPRPHIQLVPGALSPGVKRQGREADHSPPSSADVKKGGPIPPLPHISSWHSD
jgi:hypothetical protein